MYKFLFKDVIDFVGALLLLILLLPLLLSISLFLLLILRGSPFFTQFRPGKNEVIFRIIKFKTMNDKVDSDGIPLLDEQRLTKIGKIIRSLSLDELPQLINILKGELSFIGPRPLLLEYLPLYNEREKKRHLVKPGISGWAQVNGRNLISWQEKFEFDIYYIENQSFLFDLKILLLTAKNIIKREGISSENSLTMERFKGRP